MLTPEALKAQASALGFDACGIATADAHPELAFFDTWLAQGYAGTMTFLERSAALRRDVRQALPSARSVIALATLYHTEPQVSSPPSVGTPAHIARYAWGEDYHRVLMGRLDALIAWMHAVHPAPFEACPYVDTGPVQERALAQRAGIGWVGKNCCVIHPRLGSFIFLAEILCSLPLEADAPATDQCGGCRRCLDACPTQALVAPRVLDARRCISYLTIEHKGPIDPALAPLVGTHVYGCDICQEVCPYNAKAPLSPDPAWHPRPVWASPTVEGLRALTDEQLTDGLRGSAMDRARRTGMRRNIEIAFANAGDPAS